MTKHTVTKEQVQANMQDVMVRTVMEFDKPCTYVTVRMKNGFTLRESTTCVDPANYDENIGKEICLKKIEDKIWYLLGYALQEKLYREQNSEDEVKVDMFSCKAGDGIGLHVYVDGSDFYFCTTKQGRLIHGTNQVVNTLKKGDFKFEKVNSRKDLVVGNTYQLTLEGRPFLAKLQDIDLFFYTFLTVDVQDGDIEMGSMPMNEMFDMIEDGTITVCKLK